MFIRFDPVLIEAEIYPQCYEITQCISGTGLSSALAQRRIVVGVFMSAYRRRKDEVEKDTCGEGLISLDRRYLQFGCQSLSWFPRCCHTVEHKIGSF